MTYPSLVRSKRFPLKSHLKTAVVAIIIRPESSGKALMATPASSSISKQVGKKIAKELKY